MGSSDWNATQNEAWAAFADAQLHLMESELHVAKIRAELALAVAIASDARGGVIDAEFAFKQCMPEYEMTAYPTVSRAAEEAEAPTPKQIQDTLVNPAPKARSGGKDHYTDAEGNSTIPQPLDATGELGIIRVVK